MFGLSDLDLGKMLRADMPDRKGYSQTDITSKILIEAHDLKQPILGRV